MLSLTVYVGFSLFTFQLKEKKEKYEKDQEKKKDDFKSGRIVGKVSILFLHFLNAFFCFCFCFLFFFVLFCFVLFLFLVFYQTIHLLF